MDNSACVAVVGCGYWGRNHVRTFNSLGALRAVCELNPSNVQTARELAPQAKVCTKLSDVLDDPQIKGIVIATPAETHVAIAETALLAGKDVLCEKPLALRYSEARKLVSLAKKHERVLCVGHILEYHPAILKLRELVADGSLGKVQYIYSNRLNLGKIRREENILWSFAPHDIAIMLRIVGEMPFQVLAAGGTFIQPNIADVTITHLQFDNGVAGHIFVSWLNPFKEQKLVVVGNSRMAVYDDVSKDLVLYDQSVEIREREPVPIKGKGQKIEFSDAEPLKEEAKAFLSAMETRMNPLTDGESALRVLKVLQAAQRSLMTNGQIVTLPLE